MTQNDIIILDTTLTQKKESVHATLDDATYFEVFSTEQILKNYDLSYEELIDGVVGAGDDGGIDSFYTFVDGELLDEDTELSKYKKNPILDIFLIQAKQTASFTEIALDKLHSTLTNLFDLEMRASQLKKFTMICSSREQRHFGMHSSVFQGGTQNSTSTFTTRQKGIQQKFIQRLPKNPPSLRRSSKRFCLGAMPRFYFGELGSFSRPLSARRHTPCNSDWWRIRSRQEPADMSPW